MQFVGVLSGEAVYLLPGRRWMPEGQTEVERRYLKYWKKPVQMQKTNIFARIPLPTSLMLGHLPPGGRYMERYESARQTEIRMILQYDRAPRWGNVTKLAALLH